MNNIKCFAGGMSKECIDALIRYYKKNKNIGIISSRRQIDTNGGYVNRWNTEQFYSYVKSKNDNIPLGRDHAGPCQGDETDNGMSSVLNDTKYFDIIHIDPWKKTQSLEEGIEITVDIINKIFIHNTNIKFEVGTEQNIKEIPPNDFEYMLQEIKNKLEPNVFHNIKYAVIQSGMKIVGNKNIGEFNDKKTEQYLNICKNYGILSKEHNTDYCSQDIIRKLFSIGVDCINIAPEIASMHIKTILEEIDIKNYLELFKACVKTNRWQKWFAEDFDVDKNKHTLIESCGHYALSDLPFTLQNTESLYNKIESFLDGILK